MDKRYREPKLKKQHEEIEDVRKQMWIVLEKFYKEMKKLKKQEDKKLATFKRMIEEMVKGMKKG